MEAYERIYKAETDGGEIIARADTLTTIDIALRYALEGAKNRGDNYHYEQFKSMAEQIYNTLDADGYFDK